MENSLCVLGSPPSLCGQVEVCQGWPNGHNATWACSHSQHFMAHKRFQVAGSPHPVRTAVFSMLPSDMTGKRAPLLQALKNAQACAQCSCCPADKTSSAGMANTWIEREQR